VAYSGFSASNYLEQPYNSDLDFGTGDFSVIGWVNIVTPATTQILIDRGTSAAPGFGLYIASSLFGYVCSATNAGITTSIAATAGMHHLALIRSSGVVYLYVDGVNSYSTANVVNITNAIAKTVIGANYDYSSPCLGSLALWRISATAPSADQIAQIYRDELKLFQANAQCALV